MCLPSWSSPALRPGRPSSCHSPKLAFAQRLASGFLRDCSGCANLPWQDRKTTSNSHANWSFFALRSATRQAFFLHIFFQMWLGYASCAPLACARRTEKSAARTFRCMSIVAVGGKICVLCVPLPRFGMAVGVDLPMTYSISVLSVSGLNR